MHALTDGSSSLCRSIGLLSLELHWISIKQNGIKIALYMFEDFPKQSHFPEPIYEANFFLTLNSKETRWTHNH